MGVGRRSVRRVVSRRISARLRWMSWEDPFLLSRHPARGLAGRSGRRGRPWPGSCVGASRGSGGPGSRPGRIPVTAVDQQDVGFPDPGGTQSASSMLGSAVSSSTPIDFHPSSVMGLGDRPLMNRHGPPGSAYRPPYPAVGMHRALDSAIGLPRRSTNASWMLAFLTPESVRRSFIASFPGTPHASTTGHSSTRHRRHHVMAASGQATEHEPLGPD